MATRGSMWRTFGTGVAALLEDCIMEAWAWKPGGQGDEAEDEDADEWWGV